MQKAHVPFQHLKVQTLSGGELQRVPRQIGAGEPEKLLLIGMRLATNKAR